jgi:hypothetical protein
MTTFNKQNKHELSILVLQRPSKKPEIPSNPQKPPRSPGKALEKLWISQKHSFAMNMS